MEPLNVGYIGDEHFVHCSEIDPSTEVEMYEQYRQGANSVSIATLQSVHYQRFHCIGFCQEHELLSPVNLFEEVD